jgi:hypothetical protein
MRIYISNLQNLEASHGGIRFLTRDMLDSLLLVIIFDSYFLAEGASSGRVMTFFCYVES